MKKRKRILLLSCGLLATGLAGLAVLYLPLWPQKSPAPRKDAALSMKEMVRQGFEKNKELAEESSRLRERHVELIRHIQVQERKIRALQDQAGSRTDSAEDVSPKRETGPPVMETLRKTARLAHERRKALWRFSGRIEALEQSAAAERSRRGELENKLAELSTKADAEKEDRGINDASYAEDTLREPQAPAAETPGEPAAANPTTRQKQPAENRKAPEAKEGPAQCLDEAGDRPEEGEREIKRVDETFPEQNLITQPQGSKAASHAAAAIETQDLREKQLKTDISALKSANQKLSAQEASLKRHLTRDRQAYHYNLGLAYLHAGLFKDAETMFQKVLKENPQDADVHYHLGILYDEHLADLRKGIEHYRIYLSLAPEGRRPDQVRTWISIAQGKLGSGRQSARDSSKEAVKRLFFANPR